MSQKEAAGADIVMLLRNGGLKGTAHLKTASRAVRLPPTPQKIAMHGAHCCAFPSTVLASLLFLSTYSLLNYNECYKRTVGRGVVLDTQ